MNLVYEINWTRLCETLLIKSLFQLHLNNDRDVTLEYSEATEQNKRGLNSIYNISKFQV